VTTVVVAGALANKPHNGGEAWVRLTWLRGLADLGLDVQLVESADVPPDGEAADWFDQVVGWAGIADRSTLLDARGECLRGPGPRLLQDVAADGAALLDLSGTLTDPALLASFRRRAFVDLDPGWTQLWDAAGLLGDRLDRYDLHLTVGDAVPTCGLPLSGRHWRTIRPLVLTSDWEGAPAVSAGPPAPLTTVGSWRSPSGTMPYDGRDVGGKARPWRPLAGLPRAVPQPCTAVVAAHPADAADLDALTAGGWSLLTPAAVATPAAYRSFVQQSAGELSVAQEMYVATACGWTSDRTGRLPRRRPAGRGAGHRFRPRPARQLRAPALPHAEQAATACRSLAAADPADLADASRRLAADAFSTRVVLPRVLELLGAA
jgi:hypothetical protein